MCRVAIILSAVCLTGINAESISLDGKWSSGIGIHSLNNLTANISILRGISKSTALTGGIFLETRSITEVARVKIKTQNVLNNSSWKFTSTGIGVGWKKSFWLEKSITPYIGLGPSFYISKNEFTDYKRNSWEARFRLAFGAEYFLNDNLSLSNNFNFASYSFEKAKEEYDGESYESSLSTYKLKLNPMLIFRLYF
jgi:hypothetical protein